MPKNVKASTDIEILIDMKIIYECGYFVDIETL